MTLLRTSTMLLAGVAILLGSAGVLITNEVACITLVVFGVLQGTIGLLITKYGKTPGVASLVCSALAMIVTAQTVPRLIRMIAGTPQTMPGTITVLAILSVLCLIHLTLGIRWLTAKQ